MYPEYYAHWLHYKRREKYIKKFIYIKPNLALGHLNKRQFNNDHSTSLFQQTTSQQIDNSTNDFSTKRRFNKGHFNNNKN